MQVNVVERLEAMLAAELYKEYTGHVKVHSPRVVMAAIAGVLYRIAEASNKTVEQVTADLTKVTLGIGDPDKWTDTDDKAA